MTKEQIRKRILESEDFTTKKVRTPEWGGDIYVRTLPYIEARKIWKDSQANDDDKDTYATRIVAKVCCTKEGERIFSDEDAKALVEKSAKVIQRVMKAVNKLNGEDAEELEDIEKKS